MRNVTLSLRTDITNEVIYGLIRLLAPYTKVWNRFMRPLPYCRKELQDSNRLLYPVLLLLAIVSKNTVIRKSRQQNQDYGILII